MSDKYLNFGNPNTALQFYSATARAILLLRRLHLSLDKSYSMSMLDESGQAEISSAEAQLVEG